jgi:hypothetical protein
MGADRGFTYLDASGCPILAYTTEHVDARQANVEGHDTIKIGGAI